MILFYLLLITFATVSTAQLETVAGCNYECALLNGKVYCFFGDQFFTPKRSSQSNQILSLDLTNATGKSATELEAEWNIVSSDTNGVDIAPRTNPQASDLGDGRRILFNGGYFAGFERLVDPTIVYDAVDNKWSKYEPYTESPYGPRQIYYGSAVQVPDKGIAFYGGYEEFINTSWTTPSLNVSSFSFAENVSRSIGFTVVTYFNPKSQIWSSPIPLSTWTAAFLANQKSIYDPINHRILFIGGVAHLNEEKYTNYLRDLSFSSAWSFDTVKNTWTVIKLHGKYPKVGRLFHTLHLAPSTNKDVIMYGGEDFGGKNSGKASKDYCYTLSLETYKWKRVKIEAPSHTALARTRHSATLVSNDTLLIMWGVGPDKIGLSSMLILNISDPYNIKLSDKYIASK